jgi:dienelactone hydrolase
VSSYRLPAQDRRATEVRHYQTPTDLPVYTSAEEWQERAAEIRAHILACAGLSPQPKKTPLHAKIFGRVEHDGYSVERVHFESYPGFLVTGNLYRPTDLEGPLPAVLNAHGHWHYGRLEATVDSHIPRRCVDLARMGYLAFAYDMVGYNDSFQLPHAAIGGRREQLWGVGLLGLQLWNSIRALDFVSALPDVDAARVACTGASGGGTQTFLLAAVDDRVAVSVPVNMVSAHFHGGCVCENAPHLRLALNNVEIAGAIAPRPQLLVSATGDWTKDNPTVEHPWLQGLYGLFGAKSRAGNYHQEAGHNYNQKAREAVYAWLAKWLGGPEQQRRFREGRRAPGHIEDLRDLLVFHGVPKPPVKVGATPFVQARLAEAKAQLKESRPTTKAELTRCRLRFGPTFYAALGAQPPAPHTIVIKETAKRDGASFTAKHLLLGRIDQGDRLPAVLLTPEGTECERPVLIASDKGTRAVWSGDRPSPLAKRLLQAGHWVTGLDCFGTGEAQYPPRRDEDDPRFTTYNTRPAVNQVQDILTAIGALRKLAKNAFVPYSLVGQGAAGLWCLLARAGDLWPTADVIDLNGFDPTSDDAFLAKLDLPLLRRAGDLTTALALAAPMPLALHNAGPAFPTAWVKQLYRALGAKDALMVQPERLSDAEIVAFLAR